jgi:hypothetical protein
VKKQSGRRAGRYKNVGAQLLLTTVYLWPAPRPGCNMVSAQASTTGFAGADTSEMWVHRPRRMHGVSQSCGAQVEGVASVFSAMDAMDQGAVFSSLCYNNRIDITDTRRGDCWNSCKWVLAAGDGRNAGNCRIQAALLPSGEAWSIEINDKGLHRSLSLRYKPMATPAPV